MPPLLSCFGGIRPGGRDKSLPYSGQPQKTVGEAFMPPSGTLFRMQVVFAPEGGINPSPTVGSPKKTQGSHSASHFFQGKVRKLPPNEK